MKRSGLSGYEYAVQREEKRRDSGITTIAYVFSWGCILTSLAFLFFV